VYLIVADVLATVWPQQDTRDGCAGSPEADADVEPILPAEVFSVPRCAVVSASLTHLLVTCPARPIADPGLAREVRLALSVGLCFVAPQISSLQVSSN
jgi:hypothetical protein